MAIPAIPAQGAPWLSYAQGLDDEIRTGRLSDTGLRAAFGPWSRPADTVVILGDSITEQCSIGATPDDTYLVDVNPGLHRLLAKGYFLWANTRLGGRLKLLRNAGQGFNTMEQIAARVDTQVLPYKPGWCIVEGGIGSIGASVPLATMQASLTSIYTKLLANGIVPVATTCLPAAMMGTQPQKDSWVALNAWIRQYAKETPGILLCDWAACYSDVSGYTPRAALSDDGTHPNATGATLLGEVLATVLAPYMKSSPTLCAVAADAITANPFMSGSGTSADSFSVAAISGPNATASLVSRTDGLPGNWQQIVATGASETWLYQNVSTGYSVGDHIYAELEFERNADWAGTTVFGLSVEASGTNELADAASPDTPLGSAARLPMSGVLRTQPLVVKTGATQMSAILRFITTAGTLRVSRFAVRKV